MAATETTPSAPDHAGPEPVRAVHIKPEHGFIGLDFGELVRYRELLYFLCWRDIKVRYKQTALGATWALVQPLLFMAVFALFIGQYVDPPGNAPYAVFAYAALLPWTFFASAVLGGSKSMVENSNLVSKVWFPRLFMPVAAVGSYLLDLALGFLVLVVVMVVAGVTPTANIVWLPLLTLLAALAAMGVGVLSSAVNVRYRDVAYAVPFMVQLWLFATPVAYAANVVPDKWQWLYGLNPMAGVVEGFRWALIGGVSAPTTLLIGSVVSTTVLLLAGIAYFQRTERGFADVI